MEEQARAQEKAEALAAYKNLSPLQKLVKHPLFDAIIMGIILINCILLAIQSPTRKTPKPEFVLDIIFNTVYVFEVVLRVLALGLVKYVQDSTHIIDIIVSIVSLLELIVLIVNGIALDLHKPKPLSTVDALRTIKILRVLRALRPLKALTFLPFVVNYINAVVMSAKDIILNLFFLAFAISCCAILFFAAIKDRLTYRCIPSDFTNPNVLGNQYYMEFGASYFNSSYNSNVCGYRNCESGFSCEKIAQPFETILGDFSTPWFSYITTLSFVTLRGWPHVFWGIHDAQGPYIALLVLMLTPIVTNFLVVNLFPAVFIVSLKRGDEINEKRDLLTIYPGDINQITEIELLSWAHRNQREITYYRRNKKKKIHAERMKMLPWLSPANNPKKKHQDLDSSVKNGATAVPTEDIDLESDGEESTEHVEDEYQTKILVPNCLGCNTLRDIFTNDGGKFARFVLFIVLCNIFILAIDSNDANQAVADTIFYSNIVFNAIYGFDVLVKLLVLGPVRYFCSPLNDLDFILTLLGLLGVGGITLPSFLNNFRILRLLRLLRLYRLLALVDTEKALKVRDPSINIDKLAFMLGDVSLPLLNVTVLMLLLLYIYAIFGMNMFAGYNFRDRTIDQLDYFNTTAISVDKDYGTLLPNANLKYRWWGENLSRLNFGNFARSFITIFNVMVMNSWYDIMIDTMTNTGNTISPWFFMAFFVISNYFLVSTLIASISTFMEKFAADAVNVNAKSAKALIVRVKKLQERLVLRDSFVKWRKQTDVHDASAGAVDTAEKHRKYVKIDEAEEDALLEPPLTRFMKHRRFHSLYIFGRSNKIRIFIRRLVSTVAYQVLVSSAILISVIAIVTLDSTAVMPKEDWDIVNFYVPFVFFLEMILNWIDTCLWGTRDAYFNSPLNWLDFVVNVVLAISYFDVVDRFSDVRIARIAKLPQVFLKLARSETMTAIIKSYQQAWKSLLTVTICMFLAIAFFGVVGLQIWLGQFGACSYGDYPADSNRFKSSSLFPNGCNGTAYLPVYGLNSSELVELSWNSQLDNFDNIFTSCKTVFKVMMFNNWENILFSALDAVNVDVQPKENNSAASFLYFMVLVYFAFALGALFTSVLYYHFSIARAQSGSLIIGENAALWTAFRDKLFNVQTQKLQHFSTHKASPIKRYLHHLFKRNTLYRWLSIVYSIVPVLLIMSYREISYGNLWFVFIDFGLSVGYIIEYLMRLYVNDFHFYESLLAKYELLIVLGLSLHILVCMIVFSGYPRDNIAVVVTYVAVLLRTYRVVVSYPQLHLFIKSVINSLPGFIPTLLNMLFIIILYGEIAMLSFKDQTLEFDNDFLNEHYHFRDIKTACVTLVAMGTGNMWTEILNQLKSNQAFGWKVWIEFLFTSFYLLFFFLLRATAIIVIFKYSVYGGGAIGLAQQQLRAFRRAWLKLHNPPTVDVNGLIKLLRLLPRPLGVGREADFLSAVRFTKKVMLCLPASKIDPNDLFTEDSLPDDVRDMKEKDPKKTFFAFRQVLVAVHKRCMLGCHLSDEEQYLAKRQLHQSRLGRLKIRIGRLLVSKHDSITKPNFHSSATRMLLVLQRTDPYRFKALYLQLMNEYIAGVRKNIQSFGFRGFDSFFINCLSKASKNQHRAAALQLKLRKTMNNPFLNSEAATLAYETARNYEVSVRRIHEKTSELSDKYVGKLWNVHDMNPIAKFQEKGTVSAVAMDSSNNIFAGMSTGVLKIWKCTTGGGDISKESRYRAVQEIPMENWIRCLCISSDGLVLFVGTGNETVMLTNNGRRKRLHFVERRRFKDHAASVNAIVHYGRFLITASDDGYIYFYNLTTGLIVNSYYILSKIYCMKDFNIVNSDVPIDDVFCTDAVACGSANGYVTVLPLPLLVGGDVANETQSIEGISLYGGNCPVSSVRSAWNYLYAGFADGTVKIWSILLKKNSGSPRYPIRMVNLIKVGLVALHAGPVTAITHTGGHLFTTSHDFSIIPWTKPEKSGARSESEYSQHQVSGAVVHMHAVVCMGSNNNALITGDDRGLIVVSVPRSYEDQFSDQNMAGNSKVLFSFLEYDFKACFIPLNGCIIEELALLNITNTSTKKVTIRCLFRKNATFSVETNTVMNMKSGTLPVTRTSESGRVIELFELSPNRMAQYRILFTPTAEQVYSDKIDFLVNEKTLMSVTVRGMGVKNNIIVEEGRTLIDFDSVPTRTSIPNTLKLRNISSRPISVSVFDEPVKLSDNSVISLESQNISIQPRCFVIKEDSVVAINVIYHPQRVMTSFDIPLRFVCSGAVCTLANIRGRSNEVVSTDGSVPFTSPDISNDKERPKGLRLLHHTESLCPGNLTNMLLNSTGFRVLVSSHSATLLHINSGAFLEFINPSKIDKSWQHANVVDTIRLTFRCQHENPFQDLNSESPLKAMMNNLKRPKASQNDLLFGNDESIVVEDIDHGLLEQQKNSFYEIWHGERLLQYGTADFGKTVESFIKYDDIFFHDKNKSNNDNKIHAVGYQMLELLIFSLGQVPRQTAARFTPKTVEPDYTSRGIKYGSLRSISYIKFVQGYRVCRADEKGDIYSVYNRIDVVGVEKVVTFLPRGLGSIIENFGEVDHLDVTEDQAQLGSSAFSPVSLSLRSSDNGNHYRIIDGIWTLENISNVRQIKQQKTIRHDTFKNVMGTEVINLGRPVVKGLAITEENAIRKIEIEILRREILSDSGATELKLLKTCVVYTKMVQQVDLRASTLKIAPSRLLPHELKSHPLSLSVEVVQPPGESLARMASLNLTMDLLRAGRETRSDNLSNLFDGQWYFVIEYSRLKLLSADADVTAIADIYQTQSAEISLEAHGFSILLEDRTGIRVSGSMVERSDDTEIFPLQRLSHKLIRQYNITGSAHKPMKPPTFLETAWRIIARDAMIEEVRRGMVGLVKKRQIRARYEAEKQVALWMKQLEDKQRDALASRINKNPTASEIEEKKALEMRCAKLLDELQTKQTYKEVFTELTNTLEEYFSANDPSSWNQEASMLKKSRGISRLSVALLSTYLTTVPLPGFDGPLSDLMVQTVLREIPVDSNFHTTIEFFKTWFLSNEGKKEVELLNDRNMFALLLDTELRQLEGVLESSGTVVDNISPIIRPGDAVISKHRLDYTWIDRDTKQKEAIEELLLNAFTFTYKGVVRKGDATVVNYSDGVEFLYDEKKLAKKRKSAKIEADAAVEVASQSSKGWFNRMFTAGSTKKPAVDHRRSSDFGIEMAPNGVDFVSKIKGTEYQQAETKEIDERSAIRVAIGNMDDDESLYEESIEEDEEVSSSSSEDDPESESDSSSASSD